MFGITQQEIRHHSDDICRIVLRCILAFFGLPAFICGVVSSRPHGLSYTSSCDHYDGETMTLNGVATVTASMGGLAALLSLIFMRRALGLEKPLAFLCMRIMDVLTVLGTVLGTIFLYLPWSSDTHDASTLGSISDSAKFLGHCEASVCECAPPAPWIALAVFLGFMAIPVLVVLVMTADSILASDWICCITSSSPDDMVISGLMDRDSYSALEGGEAGHAGPGIASPRVDVIILQKSTGFKKEVHIPARKIEALREAIQDAFDFQVQENEEILVFRKGDLIVYNDYDVKRLRQSEELNFSVEARRDVSTPSAANQSLFGVDTPPPYHQSPSAPPQF